MESAGGGVASDERREVAELRRSGDSAGRPGNGSSDLEAKPPCQNGVRGCGHSSDEENGGQGAPPATESTVRWLVCGEIRMGGATAISDVGSRGGAGKRNRRGRRKQPVSHPRRGRRPRGRAGRPARRPHEGPWRRTSTSTNPNRARRRRRARWSRWTAAHSRSRKGGRRRRNTTARGHRRLPRVQHRRERMARSRALRAGSGHTNPLRALRPLRTRSPSLAVTSHLLACRLFCLQLGTERSLELQIHRGGRGVLTASLAARERLAGRAPRLVHG